MGMKSLSPSDLATTRVATTLYFNGGTPGMLTAPCTNYVMFTRGAKCTIEHSMEFEECSSITCAVSDGYGFSHPEVDEGL